MFTPFMPLTHPYQNSLSAVNGGKDSWILTRLDTTDQNCLKCFFSPDVWPMKIKYEEKGSLDRYTIRQMHCNVLEEVDKSLVCVLLQFCPSCDDLWLDGRCIKRDREQMKDRRTPGGRSFHWSERLSLGCERCSRLAIALNVTFCHCFSCSITSCHCFHWIVILTNAFSHPFQSRCSNI